MTRALRRDSVRVLALVGLLVLALTSPFAGGVVAQEENTTATPTPTPTPTPTTSSGDGDSGDADPPTLAEKTRVSAALFDTEYANVQAIEPGQQYNITGRVAVFATSNAIAAARVEQPGAEATVLDGDRTIQVEWNADAAPGTTSSFYRLQLFFEDNSTRAVDLYVTRTDQQVVRGKVANAGPLIKELADDAEEHGFAPTLDGIERYHRWEKAQADFFDGWLSADLQNVKAATIIVASTGLLVILLAVLALLQYRRNRARHARKIRALTDSALTKIKRRELLDAWRTDEQQAAESRLEDVPTIGTTAVHYEELFNVSTEQQLGDLLARGRVRTDSDGRLVRKDPSRDGVDPVRDRFGDIVTDANGGPLGPPATEHDGIADIERALKEGDALEKTWIEPIIRDEHLGSARRFLAESKHVLQRLAERRGLPQYRKTEHRVAQALDHLNDGTGKLQTVDTQADGYMTAARQRSRDADGGSGSPAGGAD
jgi:hypothetical protein